MGTTKWLLLVRKSIVISVFDEIEQKFFFMNAGDKISFSYLEYMIIVE